MFAAYIRLQLFTTSPIFFHYNYPCRRVKWGEHGTYETLATLPSQHQPHLNPRKCFLIKEYWVEIYSNQKAINYISPSNIGAGVETRPPKLPNLLQFSHPSIPDILGTSPRASWGSAIHVFLVSYLHLYLSQGMKQRLAFKIFGSNCTHENVLSITSVLCTESGLTVTIAYVA